jgi:hypothetical protein
MHLLMTSLQFTCIIVNLLTIMLVYKYMYFGNWKDPLCHLVPWQQNEWRYNFKNDIRIDIWDESLVNKTMCKNYWYINNTVTTHFLKILCTLRHECIIFGKYNVTMNTEIWIQIYGGKDRTYFDNYVRDRYARTTDLMIKDTLRSLYWNGTKTCINACFCDICQYLCLRNN